MYLVDGVIRGVFGAVWALLRVPEGIIRKVQLGGYRALWANPGLDHMHSQMVDKQHGCTAPSHRQVTSSCVL